MSTATQATNRPAEKAADNVLSIVKGEQQAPSVEIEDRIDAPTPSPALRSIRDIVRDLSKPVAKRHLRTRKQGGKELTYIAWFDAIKYLDHYAPGWSYEIRSIQSVGGKLIMTTRISIPCLEGVVYREASGQEEEETSSFGDPSSNAESMSLRRAAAKFGVGIELYNK